MASYTKTTISNPRPQGSVDLNEKQQSSTAPHISSDPSYAQLRTWKLGMLRPPCYGELGYVSVYWAMLRPLAPICRSRRHSSPAPHKTPRRTPKHSSKAPNLSSNPSYAKLHTWKLARLPPLWYVQLGHVSVSSAIWCADLDATAVQHPT